MYWRRRGLEAKSGGGGEPGKIRSAGVLLQMAMSGQAALEGGGSEEVHRAALGVSVRTKEQQCKARRQKCVAVQREQS